MLGQFRRDAADVLTLADANREEFAIESCEAALAALEDLYQQLKAELLRAGANGSITVSQMEVLLQAASLTRRAAQQAVKAARRLHALRSPAQTVAQIA